MAVSSDSTPATTASTQGDELDPYRLPAGVSPSRYDVRLAPSLEDASFSGAVTIQLDIDVPTTSLVLNAAELDIASCLVNGADAAFSLDAETERLVVRPANELPAGSATLTVTFTGVLNDRLRGFYRSTHIDADGTEQVIATTQMQSTDCRRAFPCWDEPEWKAVFGITLDIAEGLQAISNGPEVDRTEANGRVVIRFADTMIMSTYLVAFVVGRLETSATVDVNGSPMRLVHVPGKGHLTDFGMDVGGVLSALVRGVLRHPVSERQGRPRCAARLRRGRDGEPGMHHVP